MSMVACPHCGAEFNNSVPGQHERVCADRTPTLRSLHDQRQNFARTLHNRRSRKAGHGIRYIGMKEAKGGDGELKRQIKQLDRLIAKLEEAL